MFRYERYKRTRFWAVYNGEELIAVVVYRKGARSLIRWLTKGGESECKT
jgi:hypothetical protein